MSVHALVVGPVQTVTFDVGGRIHKVSDLLLKKQHRCTLGQLRDRTVDYNEPIFIDRDGDLFVYVLNYLREGEIEFMRKHHTMRLLNRFSFLLLLFEGYLPPTITQKLQFKASNLRLSKHGCHASIMRYQY